jgi:hypothetical protein
VLVLLDICPNFIFSLCSLLIISITNSETNRWNNIFGFYLLLFNYGMFCLRDIQNSCEKWGTYIFHDDPHLDVCIR